MSIRFDLNLKVAQGDSNFLSHRNLLVPHIVKHPSVLSDENTSLSVLDCQVQSISPDSTLHADENNHQDDEKGEVNASSTNVERYSKLWAFITQYPSVLLLA